MRKKQVRQLGADGNFNGDMVGSSIFAYVCLFFSMVPKVSRNIEPKLSTKVWVIYVQQPEEYVGSRYRDHSVAIEGCVAECTKNVTDTALQNLQGKHASAVGDFIDDSFQSKLIDNCVCSWLFTVVSVCLVLL